MGLYLGAIDPQQMNYSAYADISSRKVDCVINAALFKTLFLSFYSRKSKIKLFVTTIDHQGRHKESVRCKPVECPLGTRAWCIPEEVAESVLKTGT